MSDRRYRIVHEDDAIIVIDKPSGMLVIPTPKGETNTLGDLLNRELDERGVSINAYPCHRIDRETSGIILYAKGKRYQKVMMEAFRARSVKKTYIAFAHGLVKKRVDTIRSLLYNKNKAREESAVTKYKVTAQEKEFAVLEVEPITGRTNQIRIQFKEIGHPLVGESVYAFRKDFALRFKRTALHAASLEFEHPATNERVIFSAPLPDDMKSLLNR